MIIITAIILFLTQYDRCDLHYIYNVYIYIVIYIYNIYIYIFTYIYSENRISVILHLMQLYVITMK